METREKRSESVDAVNFHSDTNQGAVLAFQSSSTQVPQSQSTGFNPIRETVAQGGAEQEQAPREAKPEIPDKGVSCRTWCSVGSKIFTLGGFACNFFSNKYTGYIGPLSNFLGFTTSSVVEHKDRQEERDKLSNKKLKYDEIVASGINVSTVNSTNGNCSTYGLRSSSCTARIVAVVTFLANTASDILMINYQYNGAREEDEGLKIAAICLGGGAIVLHWIDEHLKRTNISSEHARYDEVLKEVATRATRS
jgi:hypothetical protein